MAGGGPAFLSRLRRHLLEVGLCEEGPPPRPPPPPKSLARGERTPGEAGGSSAASPPRGRPRLLCALSGLGRSFVSVRAPPPAARSRSGAEPAMSSRWPGLPDPRALPWEKKVLWTYRPARAARSVAFFRGKKKEKGKKKKKGGKKKIN